MDSKLIRQTFLDFFKSKGHEIVPSSPMVVKNDPTLMFNNSGMAPFKDLFLGNAPIKFPRIADTQKCLRVSGKHNDLEEVGVDTYHHTMFEMLGNWSFGDYFKKDAIAWAWELLVDVYGIDKSRLYVTVFEGDAKENIPFDQEAYDNWKNFIDESRILKGNKKDNFWEMGETGPCGPCTEIHCDIRTDEERKTTDGKILVNTGHPQVIEVWNNVFMEFERRADGSLIKLPKQHVDTGMGFERLCMVLQNKQSNYDTDVFSPVIHALEKRCGKKYTSWKANTEKTQENTNIAIRVIADHIRAISFAIADGQLPGSTGAGYVIRRILRRAIRYGYQTLHLKEPFMFTLVETLAQQMGDAFPELKMQQKLIEKVIQEEETSFYRTLETGLKRLESICDETIKNKENTVSGKAVFELYDTFGFPPDLTSLITREKNLAIDESEFQKFLEEQKNRSRNATATDTEDWVYCHGFTAEKAPKTEFTGYTDLQSETRIIRYRKVKTKNKTSYQLVLEKTPFYAESGGQVGDIGFLSTANEMIAINDTKKENGIILHFCDKLPENPSSIFFANVNNENRKNTAGNHSATHLLHAALRNVLGTHVEQKGSLVCADYLRFDFSHFSKITDAELEKIERMVNEKIRENISSNIVEMAIEEAKKTGAMALFGEKYGDLVRVVTFDKNYSIELCGGTHAKASGEIGYFKITSESAIAAGVRRIEAISGVKAEEFLRDQNQKLNTINEILKNPVDSIKSLQNLIDENNQLKKELELANREKGKIIKKELIDSIQKINGLNVVSKKIDFDSAEEIKNILFELKNQFENFACAVGAEIKGKPSVSVILSDNLVKEKNMNAGTMVREMAKEIKGGGGGQPFYATAGGSDSNGLENALKKFMGLLN